MPNQMNPAMLQMLMQYMQQPQSSGQMPSPGNSSPQLPMAQPSQGAGHMPQTPNTQQPPGFLQNMTSSPTQMAAGVGLMGQAGKGISSAADGVQSMFSQGGIFGAPNAALPAGGFANGAGASSMAGAGANSGFMGGATSQLPGSFGLGGSGVGGAFGSAGAPTAFMAPTADAGTALGASAAGDAAAGGAAESMSLADLLPFLFA